MYRDKVYKMLDFVGRDRLLVCHTYLGDMVTIWRRRESYEINGTLQGTEAIKTFLGELCTHCEVV